MTAESIYEAAALGVSALKNSGWTDAMAPGTELEIEVREPATCHRLTLQQIRRWCDGVAVSPDDTLKKRRLKQLLASASAVSSSGGHVIRSWQWC